MTVVLDRASGPVVLGPVPTLEDLHVSAVTGYPAIQGTDAGTGAKVTYRVVHDKLVQVRTRPTKARR